MKPLGLGPKNTLNDIVLDTFEKIRKKLLFSLDWFSRMG